MKLCLIVVSLALCSCINYGQTVMVSKGQAGVVQSVFGTQARFCKVTTSEGVTLTEQDREAFQKFCGADE